MKILPAKQSLSADRAFDIYRKLSEQRDQLFFRSALISVVCLSVKYLGLELNELSVPVAKFYVSNPRIITGALGWFTVFFVAASATKYVEAETFARHCRQLIESTSFDPAGSGGLISNVLTIVYALLVVLLAAAVAVTMYSVWGDMLYILNSALGRISGTETFIGPFETCIQPKKS